MTPSPIRVGIPVLGGQKWVAGKIYCHNLQTACLRCDHGAPLEMTLLEPGFLPSSAKFTDRGSAEKIAYYSHIECHAESLVRRMGKIAVSQARHPGCRSLERAIQARSIDVLFPGVVEDKQGPRPCPQIYWVPDFQHCHLQEFFSEGHLETREASLRAIFETADRVILSSRDAQADARRFYPEYSSLFRVLPFVIVPDPCLFAEAPQPDVPRRFGIDCPYLMFPSQFWMHKNHKVAFQAVELLKSWNADLLLVCTGRQYDYRNPSYFKDLMREVEQLGLKRNIILTGLIPRSEHVQLLRQAKAILQPSLFEGWSALLEDARMLGKPVFVSDLPIHREQDPPQAFFFPPHDAQALADLIKIHWDDLRDGCDLVMERQAVTRQQDRGAQFIRNFFAIVRDFLQPPQFGN